MLNNLSEHPIHFLASIQSISLLWQKEEKEMAEPKDWKNWLPDPNVWKSWTPKAKGRRSGMSEQKIPNQGVVKQDWVATGRIDFATRDPADANQPSEFKLLVEERRVVESCWK